MSTFSPYTAKFSIPTGPMIPPDVPAPPGGWPTAGSIGDTPIPNSPYTGPIAGKTPNQIIGDTEQAGQNFANAPGQIKGWADDQWNNTLKPMFNKYGGIAEAGAGLGLGALLLSTL